MSGASTDPRFLGREDVFALGRMIEDMARGDGEPEKKAGMFGLRLGRREAGPLAGPLGAMVATMTITDIARREVDLNALAALLDDAAVGAGT